MTIIYMLTNCLFFNSALFCEVLDGIANGEMTCSRGNKLGSVCKFKCNNGYVLESEDHQGKLCYKNSTWIGSTAVCTESKNEYLIIGLSQSILPLALQYSIPFSFLYVTKYFPKVYLLLHILDVHKN